MGTFKKSSKKVKKNKKSSKNKGDWEFDGAGQQSEDGETNFEVKKKRILTQDKDERLRRSRRKLHDAKLKRELSKKLGSKVCFRDVVDHSDESSTSNENEKPVMAKRMHQPSLIPKVDRLQMLVSKSLAKSQPKPVKTVKSVLKPKLMEDDITKNILITHFPKSNDFQLVFSIEGSLAVDETVDIDMSNAQEEIADEALDRESDIDIDEQHQQHQEKNDQLVDYFQQFLNHETTSTATYSSSSSPPRRYQVWKHESFQTTYSYTYSISDSFVSRSLSLPSITKIQDYPRLYKLWKKSSLLSQLSLSAFHQSILPILATYADAFIDGRDVQTNDSLLECTLMHSMFHVVRSRYI
jgi:hypothetical protein